MTSGSRLLLFGTAVAMVLGGCASHRSPAPIAGTCLAADASPASSSPVPAGPAGPRVPGLGLACFDGSGDVRLDTLGRPAVISLWASWCAPCRAELPVLAAFARSTAGRVAVVGVDTGDTRTGGSSMISDLSLPYPMLFDPDSRLSNAVGRKVLPVTLFVDAGGTIAYVHYSAKPLDEQSITELAARYLGLRVGG